MRRRTTTPAQGAVVISLSERRAARSTPVGLEACAPIDVLETMIEAYFLALSAQVAAVRAAVNQKELAQ